MPEWWENEPVSYYDLLNVPRDATATEIKKAYRRLATAFHPDKQQSDDLRDIASGTFSDIQEAYEILSDPERRQIYDVYGRLGLQAGLDVAVQARTADELRREWAAFQTKQHAQRIASEAAPESRVVVRIAAAHTLADLRAGMLSPRPPIVSNATMSSSVQYRPDSSLIPGEFVFAAGGHAAMTTRRLKDGGLTMLGASKFPFEARWAPTPADVLQLNAVYGLEAAAVELSSVRQLSQRDLGQVTLSASPDGVGLRCVLRRQLFEAVSGSFSWTLGPQTGMELSLIRSHEKLSVTGRVEVGAVTSLSAVAALRPTDATMLRCVARVGTTGIDGEVGWRRRWGEMLTTYCGVMHGLLGTVVKVKVTRAGHVFEVPIVLAHAWDDWQTLLLAVTVPPALNFVVTRCLISPLVNFLAARQAQQMQREYATELRGIKAAANAKQEMLRGIVARLAKQELAEAGLVIVLAVYGDCTQYRTHLASEIAAQAETPGLAAPRAANGSTCTVSSQSAGPVAAAGENCSASANGSASRHAEACDAGAGSEEAAGAPAPRGPGDTAAREADGFAAEAPWLDVTVALQYQVAAHSLSLPTGISKRNLLGFADVKSGAATKLYVVYWFDGALYDVHIDDMEGLSLPTRQRSQMSGAEAAYFTALLDRRW